MAKRRMQAWMRDKLKAHAEKTVIPDREYRVLEATYKRASQLVRKAVQAKYPARDMRVLRRYNCTSFEVKAKLHAPDGSVLEFTFATNDAPHIASYHYGQHMYLADEATSSAVETWVDARNAYDQERKERLAAYRALIDGSSYVEDLIEVWPEAEGVVPANALPIPLGPEQIALVKRDQKERKAA